MRFSILRGRVGILFLTGLALAGCINVPELGERNLGALRDADYPELRPLGPLLGTQTAPREQSQDLSDNLIARRASLEARAASLRGEVLSPEDEERLKQGVTE